MRKILSAILVGILLCANAMAQVSNPVHIIGNRTKDNLHVSKWDVTESMVPYIMQTPLVDTSYKVYDFAGLLSGKQVTEIEKRCHEFKNNTGLDVAIVTTDETNHNAYGAFTNYEAYIQDFYDYNDFLPDGVMLCINMEYHKNSIFDAGKPNGWSFIGNRLEEYGPVMKSYFDNEDYYNEIMFFLDSVERDWAEETAFPLWWCLGIGFLLGLIPYYWHKSGYKLVFNATTANNYKADFKMTENRTDFVKTYTTKVYTPPQSSSSGGGSGSSGGGHSGGSF